jgi:predicted DNA-binding transcriptional regulator AlpA
MSRSPASDQLLKSGNVQEVLAISEPTLRRLVQGGYLTPVHIGTGGVRYRNSEVQKFIAQGGVQ